MESIRIDTTRMIRPPLVKNPRNVSTTDENTKSLAAATPPVDSDTKTTRNVGRSYGSGGRQMTDVLKVPTKNTFINFPIPRTPSEDDFTFEINPSKSCPTSGLALIPEHQVAESDLHLHVVHQALAHTPCDSEPRVLETGTQKKSNTATAVPRSDTDSTFVVMFELSKEVHGRLGLSIDYSSGTDVRIIGIDEGLVQEWNRIHANRGERLVRVGDSILSINDIRDPVLMLAECTAAPDDASPRIVEVRILPGSRRDAARGNPRKNGSQDHAEGLCRPCAYFHKPGGCDYEAECTFCHLCPPSELRRRKQVKLFFRKMMYSIQRRRSLGTKSYKLPLQAPFCFYPTTRA